MCGTNDICSTQWENVQEALDTLLSKIQHCEQLCLVQVPLRYDRKKLNYHIQRFNTKVKTYMQSKSRNVHFLNPMKFLKPSDYTVDGVHMNRKGKLKLCKKLNTLLSFDIISASSSNNHKFSNLEPNLAIEDLIDLENQDLVLPHVSLGNSTFSPDTNYTKIFPEETPHKLFHSSNFVQSILDTPNVLPDYISNIIRNDPYSSNFYRLAHLSQNSSQNTVEHSSPIPTTSLGYIRPQNSNFLDPGQTSTT